MNEPSLPVQPLGQQPDVVQSAATIIQNLEGRDVVAAKQTQKPSVCNASIGSYVNAALMPILRSRCVSAGT
ncbi:MAG: hypothetical protein JSR46_01390 [Verrucomicrobia bacterium]|nr:hypothetical protein [Verrucomicrobiota bacterium]